jgi:hypothetical protein
MDSVALLLGLVGVLTAGFFFNRLYAEAIYWLAAFAAVLRNIHAQVVAEAVAVTPPDTPAVVPANVPPSPYAGASVH